MVLSLCMKIQNHENRRSKCKKQLWNCNFCCRREAKNYWNSVININRLNQKKKCIRTSREHEQYWWKISKNIYVFVWIWTAIICEMKNHFRICRKQAMPRKVIALPTFKSSQSFIKTIFFSLFAFVLVFFCFFLFLLWWLE